MAMERIVYRISYSYRVDASIILQEHSQVCCEGRRLVGVAVYLSSTEPSELSQWLWQDDSTTNIVLSITIFIVWLLLFWPLS